MYGLRGLYGVGQVVNGILQETGLTGRKGLGRRPFQEEDLLGQTGRETPSEGLTSPFDQLIFSVTSSGSETPKSNMTVLKRKRLIIDVRIEFCFK